MKVIASHNGLSATREAFRLLAGGGDLMDAVVGGIQLVEDDPRDMTVGYGGLPNEEGVVELDAAVMDGRIHRGAGVAALQGIRHPTRVAQLVMQQTGRVLLAGEGAKQFALAQGFKEENLLTDEARRMWLYWKRKLRGTGDDWLPPEPDDDLELQSYYDKRFYFLGGTVHVAAQDAAGGHACATSTSGHAFKLPGRVGDSPILGAGLYADNDVGSCGSIGHGEANLQHCSSFAAVELMRGGRTPREAGLEVLRRIAAKCEPRLRDKEGRPKFNLMLFLLAKDGTHAGLALRPGKRIAVTDESGSRIEECVSLY